MHWYSNRANTKAHIEAHFLAPPECGNKRFRAFDLVRSAGNRAYDEGRCEKCASMHPDVKPPTR